jgi:hypothetical protein
MELPGCPERRAEVEAAVDQDARDAGEAVRVAEQRAFFEPGGVGEVVGADADERELRRRRP